MMILAILIGCLRLCGKSQRLCLKDYLSVGLGAEFGRGANIELGGNIAQGSLGGGVGMDLAIITPNN